MTGIRKKKDFNHVYEYRDMQTGKKITFSLLSQPAIEPIGGNMHEQTNGNNPGSCGQEQYKIHGDGNITMQRMEANAATGRIIDGRCQQMICIYQHGKQKQQPGFKIILSVKSKCNKKRKNKMQKIVNKKAHVRIGF
jgi:hypothetical protein